jgi:hypothetical protein
VERMREGMSGEEDGMLTYAHVCSRMLTYADVCMLSYADVCSRMLTCADV